MSREALTGTSFLSVLALEHLMINPVSGADWRPVTDFLPPRPSRLPRGHFSRSDHRAMAVLVPASAGVGRADTPMSAGLLVGAAVIVGALTSFPAVSLEPIVGQLSHGRFF